jgi:glutathione S-transferase
MNRALDVATSLAATVVRGGVGRKVGAVGPRPALPVELYDFEACPFCRKVREALSILDLGAIVYPCPKGGRRFRSVVEDRGGRAMFPYLVDPNTGTEMYESDAIVAHLFREYGDGGVPISLRLGALTALGGSLASGLRLTRGVQARAAHEPAELLELYSYEASPFCRIVRECLTTLELPYRLHNVASGSASRPAFIERSGKMMVPYLVDPNAGVELFESADIVAHLERNYAL